VDWRQTLLIAPLFLTVPIALFLLYYLFRQRGLSEYPLMILIGSASIWATSYGLELSLPTFEQKMKVVTFEYVGIVLAPFGWLLLGLQLQDQLYRLKLWMLALLAIVPILTIVQVATWEYHGLFWVQKELVQNGALLLISNTYGPGFWLHFAFSYSLQLTGGVLIFVSVFQSTRFYMRQRVALGFALLLPWMANAIYVAKVGDVPIDFTPLSMMASALLIIVGVLRFRLGDLLPVARKKLVAEMREGMMLFDDRNRLIDANPAALKMFELTETAFGETADVVLSGHSPIVQLSKQENRNSELLYTGPNDRLVHVTAENIRASGEYPCQLLVFHDLSIGNRVETALRIIVEDTSADTGEDFFRSLVKSLSVSLGARYVFIGTLPGPARDLIHSLAFWRDHTFSENVTYEILGTPCEALKEHRTVVISTGVQARYPDSKLLASLDADTYIGTRLVDYDNQVIGVLAILNDRPFANEDICRSVLEVFGMRAAAEIERRRASLELEESELRYRRIVETTRDGVCLIDHSGRIDFLNEPMANLAGKARPRLIGANLWDEFVPLDLDPAEFRAMENKTIEAHLERLDGRAIWVVLSKTIVRSELDSPGGMLIIATDVTQSRLLEEQATRMEIQLQHAQKLESLGVLAGGIAHDFNNLLMPILGYLDLIHDRTRTDSTVTEYVRRMRDAGGKLADLCNQMLTYSGKGQFVRTPMQLNELLDRLSDLVRASVSRSLEIEYIKAKDLPLITADETQLDQIVINLVINASEAMNAQKTGKILIKTGQEDLDVTMFAELHNGEGLTPGQYVYVEVADEGTGIAERDVSRLFEPFFTTKFTGRGLGMAVVFGIVKGHGGAIKVTSASGKGTRIRIYFPATDAMPDSQVNVARHAADRRGHGLVLVVDDEEQVRMIVAMMLESAGFEVRLAKNGTQGLTLFNAHRRELVGCVIDATMPELDGYGLIERIQLIDQEMPIVLVSGFQAGQLESTRIDTRRLTFLQKPFDLDELLTALRTRATSQAV
jgi:PAS domain S-box-containing protein